MPEERSMNYKVDMFGSKLTNANLASKPPMGSRGIQPFSKQRNASPSNNYYAKPPAKTLKRDASPKGTRNYQF
jgi:hypothetical protein